MQNKTQLIATAITTAILMGSAYGHDGRRLDIQVVDGQLVTQGYISGQTPVDDGNGIRRDYYNAIHGHWDSIGGILSRATLPGFDIEDQADLLGDELWLTLTGVKKWADAPFADFVGGHGEHGGHGGHTASDIGGHFMPGFIAIPNDEWVEVGFGGPLSLNTPVRLDSSVGSEGHYDLTFDYQTGAPLSAGLAPDTVLYLVEFELSTSDPSILSSDTIHVILSPSGMTVEGSHGLSLATEEALGTPVPEPSTLAIAVLLLVLMRRRRG
jgi:hypothetical protein